MPRLPMLSLEDWKTIKTIDFIKTAAFKRFYWELNNLKSLVNKKHSVKDKKIRMRNRWEIGKFKIGEK